MALTKINNNTLSAITGLPAGVGGKVLQVVSVKSTTEIASTTANTYIDSGLSLSITPTSSSNKVLVLVNQHIGIYQFDASRIGGTVKLLRSTTTIYGGLEQYELFNQFGDTTSENLAAFYHRADIKYLDSPSTTSATTYKTQIAPSETGDVIKGQLNGYESTMTLMEIAG
jgi:hypothetical protein